MLSRTKNSNPNNGTKKSNRDQTTFWGSQSIPETLKALDTNTDSGLSQIQAEERIKPQWLQRSC